MQQLQRQLLAPHVSYGAHTAGGTAPVSPQRPVDVSRGGFTVEELISRGVAHYGRF